MLLFAALLLHAFSGFVAYNVCEMFDPPSYYNEHRYYQSSFYLLNAEQAEKVCLSCGWYLAEINNEAEFRFVQTLARSANTEGLLLSGNDVNKEGYWVFQTSKQPVKFFDWYGGGPDNYQGREDYLTIHSDYGYQMNDVFFEPTRNYKFLCEVDK
ncbi:uncharacterized protein LOC131952388 [Physella acuta]|uniref:uncharacterized protein LOC131952388 n=1 Tax=Physella acuta TaxID=109671 RepID=UPI0027DE71E3|nr:uncharacterized protein LOC131952388 [Physella acuta]